MENNEMPESIWADGCPANPQEEDILKMEDLHKMAIDYVCKNVLAKNGYLFYKGFPRLEFPNVVVTKDDKSYGIVILPSVFPNVTGINDEFRLKIVESCKANKVTPLYGTVGYKSIDPDRARAQMMLKGDVFYTSFPGFVLLTDEEKQNLQVSKDELIQLN